jgi:hypothetical protein
MTDSEKLLKMKQFKSFCPTHACTIPAGDERAIALAAALVDWQRGELSPSTAGSVASEGGGFLDMTDV